MIKLLFIALLDLAYLGFIPADKTAASAKQTYFYFCLSREVSLNEEATAKRQLMYTDVYEITTDEAEFSRMAKRFSDYVYSRCRPGNELCTSDLNYCPDRQQASQRQKAMLAKYGDTGKYDVKRIDVKLD